MGERPSPAGGSASRGAAGRAVSWLYDQPPLLLTLTTLFWGGNIVAGQLAPGEVAPMQLVLARWVLVALALSILFRADIRDAWPAVRARLPIVIFMAAVGFTSFNGLFYLSSLHTTGVNQGILQGAIPVFVLMMSRAAYGTRVGPVQMVGVALTMAGVAVIATGADPVRLIESGLNPGDALMLVACACYAFYATALQRRPAVPGRAFFALMSVVAAITSLPGALAEAALTAPPMPTATGWLIILYVAAFPSCLAQLFFLRGVDLIGPGRAGVYVNLVPVFGALLSIGLLGQVAAPYHAVSLLLVLSGIWLAQRGR